LTRFSRFDIYGDLPEVMARLIHAWIGWLRAIVIIHVAVWRILLMNRHFGDNSSDSYSKVLIMIVWKHPVIALMILPCTEANACNCAIVGAVRVSPGLYQIIAP
jgi:hypothetical protein